MPWDIQDVVPHRGSMLLVDRLLHADADSATVEVVLRPDSMFMHQGQVPCYVGLEYMAQAVAAWGGAQARAGGNLPSVGYLLGTRRYDASVWSYPVGAVLQAQARMETVHQNGMAVFNCTLSLAGTPCAQAQLLVYQPGHGTGPLPSS